MLSAKANPEVRIAHAGERCAQFIAKREGRPSPRRVNRVGQKFHRLTVLQQWIEDGNRRQTFALCRCDCGVEKRLRLSSVACGNTKSCGCLDNEMQGVRAAGNRKYTDERNRLYLRWWQMIKRCERPNQERYKRYGARGIYVCERWKTFDNFMADMGLPPTDAHQLDRINNDGPYEPGNVRWVTRTEQARNTSGNRRITFNGATRCLSEWSEVLGIKAKILSERLCAGWTVERAFTQRPRLVGGGA